MCSSDLSVAEFVQTEAVEGEFLEGVDEYAPYEQVPGEADTGLVEGYDEYAQYGDYDEYAQYEGYEDGLEVPDVEIETAVDADVRDKKAKKGAKAKEKRKVAAEKTPKRGRLDWFNYDPD